MNFHPFAAAVAKRLAELETRELYTTEVGDLFETYLAAFPEGTNPIFRKCTEHDCSCCKNFIRSLGKVVGLRQGKVETLWEGLELEAPYDEVARVLDGVVRQAPISGIFRSKERQYGQEYNYDTETNQRWDHFCGKTGRFWVANPETVRGDAGAAEQVFRRGLEEISYEALGDVLNLIDNNALYRGAEFKQGILNFLTLKNAWMGSDAKALFSWEHYMAPGARLKNSVIGTLLIDLSEGVELDAAVRKFEAKVAPLNYKRPTALITPRMIDAALATVADLGLEPALERRFAKLSDVSVNNVLFVDNAVRSVMRDGGLRGALMEEVSQKAVSIAGAEPIAAEAFFSEVLPKATSVEVLLENRHLGNFVSLTAPSVWDSGKLFRWNNDFAWSYDGDAADSIKQRVKRAGGNVEAKLRVSLAWSNTDDLDIHVKAPGIGHVYYGNKAGVLDVDMNVRGESREPVENLAWNNLRDGVYEVWVKQFHKRESVDTGFAIELEYGGKISHFNYSKVLRQDENIAVCNITVQRGEPTEIKVSDLLVGGEVATEKWGLTTGALIPTEVLMASPNHWDSQTVGNKHWFFFLRGAKNPGSTRGIYNEFLSPDLEKHRKVFEVLGAKTKCPPATEQLSGVGFSAGRNDSVTVLVKGPKLNKAYSINF